MIKEPSRKHRTAGHDAKGCKRSAGPTVMMRKAVKKRRIDSHDSESARRKEIMSTLLYQNGTYEFILNELKGDGQTGAEIVRRRLQDGEEIVLFSYYWPVQLSVEVEKGDVSLREDGILCWQLHVTAHHVKGMVQGEFTETEYFELEKPFGTAQELVCRTVDIVRKTRFAIAERHLKHLPHQTYPAVEGRQGPYGHP